MSYNYYSALVKTLKGLIIVMFLIVYTTATDDYVLDPEAFSFESDTNIAMIRVEAVDDILFEDLIEKFTISLSLNNPPVNVRILKSQLVIEIKDNEGLSKTQRMSVDIYTDLFF